MSQKSNPHFNEIISQSLSRRDFVQVSLAIGTAFSLSPGNALAKGITPSKIAFKAVAENLTDGVVVPEGYEWHKLMSWGDALFTNQEEAKEQAGAPFPFNRYEQEKRVGTCNDMFAVFAKNYSYPWSDKAQSEYIVCSNNEYVVPYVMIPSQNGNFRATPQEVEALYAAQGVTIARVNHDSKTGAWSLVQVEDNENALNRRITPFSEVVFSGPAKEHEWVKTAAAITNQIEKYAGNEPKNDDGVLCGTMQNCAGGYTPWGTYLTAEENIDNMFFTTNPSSQTLQKAREHDGYEADENSFGYGNVWKLGGPDQFDLSRNPHGPSLYGWIVEIDPHDPSFAPRKHTALGRKKNESANTVITNSGQVVVYTGDDQVNEFVYKFISKGKFDAKSRIKNRELLSEGKLYAAKFNADGSGQWLEINLEAANAVPTSGFETTFKDYADMMVRVREAARRLGATPMDRPEDVEAPKDNYFKGFGTVYICATGNQSEDGRAGNAANPRRKNGETTEVNYTGQIVRINEKDKDHGATTFTWEIFLMGGDHSKEVALLERPSDGAGELHNLSSWKDGKPTTLGDRFAMPDNITFDNFGNAWFTTDGTPDTFPCNDGIYVADTNAPAPRMVKRFLTGPIGCEITGPFMSEDNKTFFCGLQHIGSADAKGIGYRGEQDTPFSTFPNKIWPRDTIIYVRRKDGGIVGT